MTTNLLIQIITLVIILAVCCILEYSHRKSVIQHNAEILSKQPDEPFNPNPIYSVEPVALGQDDHIYKLGDWFVGRGFHKRYGITFERYIQMCHNGTWQDLAGA